MSEAFVLLRVVKIRCSFSDGGLVVMNSSISRWQMPKPRPLPMESAHSPMGSRERCAKPVCASDHYICGIAGVHQPPGDVSGD